MLEFLTTYTNEIAAIAAVLAVVATIWAWLFKPAGLRPPGAKPPSEPVDVVARYREKAIALADEMKAVQGLLDVWNLNAPESTAPEARRLMKKTFSIYQEVFLYREAGKYPDDDWESAVGEMKKFLAFQYVKNNIAFADQISQPFGHFMRDLEQKS